MKITTQDIKNAISHIRASKVVPDDCPLSIGFRFWSYDKNEHGLEIYAWIDSVKELKHFKSWQELQKHFGIPQSSFPTLTQSPIGRLSELLLDVVEKLEKAVPLCRDAAMEIPYEKMITTEGVESHYSLMTLQTKLRDLTEQIGYVSATVEDIREG